MNRPPSWLRGLGLSTLAALLTIACSPSPTNPQQLSIGSKDFTEQLILGELYAQTLENQGLPVQRKFNLGGTPVAHAALTAGEIDLYPEYTGTALLTVLKEPADTDPDRVYNTVKTAYERQFQLTWLAPAPFNNTQALALTAARAQTLGLQTLSDFATQAPNLVLIGPPEFAVREDGLPGLQAAYGDFSLQNYIAVDPGLRYQGLLAGEADVAVAFGTDGEISAHNLVVLEDDLQFFPPYQVAPVVRQDTLARVPQLASILDRLGPLLTDDVMRQLNHEVSGNQREPEAVAAEFLQQSGILSSPNSPARP